MRECPDILQEILMMDLSRKESNQRQVFEHLKGNKLFVEVNRTLQQEDYSSICQKLQ